jgi:hypothetical protein
MNETFDIDDGLAMTDEVVDQPAVASLDENNLDTYNTTNNKRESLLIFETNSKNEEEFLENELILDEMLGDEINDFVEATPLLVSSSSSSNNHQQPHEQPSENCGLLKIESRDLSSESATKTKPKPDFDHSYSASLLLIRNEVKTILEDLIEKLCQSEALLKPTNPVEVVSTLTSSNVLHTTNSNESTSCSATSNGELIKCEIFLNNNKHMPSNTSDLTLLSSSSSSSSSTTPKTTTMSK